MDHKGHRKRPAGGKSTLTDRTSGPVPGLGPIRCCIRQWKYLLLQKQRGICGIRVHSSVCACWEKGTESQVGLQIEGFFAIILPNRGEHPGVCPPSSWHRVPGEGCLLNTTVTHRKQWPGPAIGHRRSAVFRVLERIQHPGLCPNDPADPGH